jgi:hypothetical protein
VVLERERVEQVRVGLVIRRRDAGDSRHILAVVSAGRRAQ